MPRHHLSSDAMRHAWRCLSSCHDEWFRMSADDHSGTHVYPARKLPELPVGERHAAVGPVDCLLDAGVATTQTVNTQLSAKRRVLGRSAMVSQGMHDGVKFCLADASLDISAAGDVR